MSKWIDVSDLDIPSDENDYDELVAFADKVAEMIVDAPSIDIVRCKECKHWSKYRTYGNQSYCEILCGYCDGDKFCAWGERIDDA